MALKKYKPITAGTRWRIGNAYAEITTDQPEKSLLDKKVHTILPRLMKPVGSSPLSAARKTTTTAVSVNIGLGPLTQVHTRHISSDALDDQ